MNRGYFYAASKPDKHDLGGFGESQNAPKTFKKGTFPKGKLSLIVKEKTSIDKQSGFLVHVVHLVNASGKEISFPAQDSRLDMVVQAKDQDGIWRNIEYVPSSWCGNSYHTLTLGSGEYWSFQTPDYTGGNPTKLRISLEYRNPSDSKKAENRQLFSNEYDGAVNPAQFWNKADYQPSGIMDPYDE